jgi:hypothetical protein
MQADSLPSQTKAQIEQLEALAVQAFRDQDMSVIDGLHDDLCVGVGLLGAEYSKAEFMSAFAALTVESINVVSTKTVLENGFAVVLSNWDVNLTFGPAVIDGRARVTRTWVKRGNTWKIISFHFSDARLAKKWEQLRLPK